MRQNGWTSAWIGEIRGSGSPPSIVTRGFGVCREESGEVSRHGVLVRISWTDSNRIHGTLDTGGWDWADWGRSKAVIPGRVTLWKVCVRHSVLAGKSGI